jgi:microsomal dipeptidase-like Zn-dependent dipeptidase
LKREGKKAIFLAIENGYAIGNDISNIAKFKELGVVYITLCHNGDNDICDSCKGNSEHCGLSDWGEKCVREMNRLGIMVDISHAADQTVRDVLEVSEAPIIASHSSARALCSHRRNLPDDLLRAIAMRDGVIQVTIYNEFVKDEPGATIQDYIAHINHVVEVAGIDHVGIGTDFDGGDGIIGLQSSIDLISITMERFKEGYSEEEIAKIWGGNLLRVMEQVQRVAEV